MQCCNDQTRGNPEQGHNGHQPLHQAGDAPKAGRNGEQNKEWERDIALDYVFQDGALKGLGLGWRYGVLRGNAATDVDQNRLIVSYTLPLM